MSNSGGRLPIAPSAGLSFDSARLWSPRRWKSRCSTRSRLSSKLGRFGSRPGRLSMRPLSPPPARKMARLAGSSTRPARWSMGSRPMSGPTLTRLWLRRRAALTGFLRPRPPQGNRTSRGIGVTQLINVFSEWRRAWGGPQGSMPWSSGTDVPGNLRVDLIEFWSAAGPNSEGHAFRRRLRHRDCSRHLVRASWIGYKLLRKVCRSQNRATVLNG